MLHELILKGTHQSFDAVVSKALKSDYSFTLFEATYRERNGKRIEPTDYISFGLATEEGILYWQTCSIECVLWSVEVVD